MKQKYDAVLNQSAEIVALVESKVDMQWANTDVADIKTKKTQLDELRRSCGFWHSWSLSFDGFLAEKKKSTGYEELCDHFKVSVRIEELMTSIETDCNKIQRMHKARLGV